MILILKFICLFFGITWGMPILINGCRGGSISEGWFLLAGLGWAGFITLQWLV